jgi:hypothetical protein
MELGGTSLKNKKNRSDGWEVARCELKSLSSRRRKHNYALLEARTSN